MKQIFQFTIEWLAGDKPFQVDELHELLENGLGKDYDNEISDVKEIK
jgi:hypothetical protein